ncbi:hypothetical protein [Pseudomonas abietaniphila]|uniref:Uncharacterized protein n=1 Tax=Pseudomonas abietaniphila TaxID=89065 RepID=A0A1G8K7U3_9PSED|nr:hypothetical protein [Pseudomonas abietaniphila]SDI39491.1 hypothetical protein SAMN05216605_1134 [Pseudomonas abietaniphila]
MQPTRFSYLLISTDENAIMVALQQSVDLEMVHNKEGIHAFLSDTTFGDLEVLLRAASKEFGLVQTSNVAYQTSNAALSQTLSHIV